MKFNKIELIEPASIMVITRGKGMGIKEEILVGGYKLPGRR